MRTSGARGRVRRLRRLVPMIAVTMAMVMAPAVGVVRTASAVVNGAPTGPDQWAYVGTLIVDIADPDVGTHEYHYWCSGTMVSPTVFLTAGHCFNDDYLNAVFGGPGMTVEIRGVSLDDDVSALQALPSPLYTGTGHQIPGWPGKHWYLDVGAFVLDEPLTGPFPALPTAGQLGSMELTGTTATIVGYGIDRDPTRGPHGFTDWTGGIRSSATQRVTGVGPELMHLLGNITVDNGGPCAGDSGAPRFVSDGGTVMVAAISNWIGPKCQTPEMALRLDNQAILDFIADPTAT